MLRAMCSIAVFAVLVASLPLQAEPICLGQIIETYNNETLPQRDPDWASHEWLYTTIEGTETGFCLLCDGDWETVPTWVAGLDILCTPKRRSFVSCAVSFWSVRIPLVGTVAYPVSHTVEISEIDLDECMNQIRRCPVVIGC